MSGKRKGRKSGGCRGRAYHYYRGSPRDQSTIPCKRRGMEKEKKHAGEKRRGKKKKKNEDLKDAIRVTSFLSLMLKRIRRRGRDGT